MEPHVESEMHAPPVPKDMVATWDVPNAGFHCCEKLERGLVPDMDTSVVPQSPEELSSLEARLHWSNTMAPSGAASLSR